MELTFPETAVGGSQEQVVQKKLYNLVHGVPKTNQFVCFFYELVKSQRIFLTAVLNVQVMALQSAQPLMTADLERLMKMAC